MTIVMIVKLLTEKWTTSEVGTMDFMHCHRQLYSLSWEANHKLILEELTGQRMRYGIK